MKSALLIVVGVWVLASSSAGAQTIGPPYQIQCNQFTSGTGTAQIATAVTNQSIMVCGWDVEATVAAAAFSLSYGTGTTCATNTVAISPAYAAMPAGENVVDHIEFAGIQVPSGKNLCVTVATSVAYTIFWGQY